MRPVLCIECVPSFALPHTIKCARDTETISQRTPSPRDARLVALLESLVLEHSNQFAAQTVHTVRKCNLLVIMRVDTRKQSLKCFLVFGRIQQEHDVPKLGFVDNPKLSNVMPSKDAEEAFQKLVMASKLEIEQDLQNTPSAQK